MVRAFGCRKHLTMPLAMNEKCSAVTERFPVRDLFDENLGEGITNNKVTKILKKSLKYTNKDPIIEYTF